MRNVLLTVAFVLATFISANAQFYLGGSLSLENSYAGESKTSLWIQPTIGYYINNKFDVGVDFGFNAYNGPSETKLSMFFLEPYARYSFFQIGRFEVLAKGSAGLISLDNSTLKSTRFRLYASPILTYNLTDKIVLFTQLDFFSFSFALDFPKDGDLSYSFHLGASNNLVNTSNFPIGFYYKF